MGRNESRHGVPIRVKRKQTLVMTNKAEQAIEKIVSVLLDVHSDSMDDASYFTPKQNHPTLTERADEILTVVESLGYVQKSEDQSLPENPHKIDITKPFAHMDYTDEEFAEAAGYSEGQQDMLKANFVKVEKE